MGYFFCVTAITATIRLEKEIMIIIVDSTETISDTPFLKGKPPPILPQNCVVNIIANYYINGKYFKRFLLNKVYIIPLSMLLIRGLKEDLAVSNNSAFI